MMAVMPAPGGAVPAPQVIPVSGQVLWPAGSPLKNVRVLLVRVVSQIDQGRLELEGKAGPEPAASASVGPDGSFRLEVPEPGMWKVVIESPGLVPQEIGLLPLFEETALPAVRLERDAGLEVRVAGADGAPVSGARVRAEDGAGLDAMNPFRPSWRVPVRTARTDAKGVAVLPRREGERLLVQAGGDGPFVQQSSVRSGAVTLRLPAGTSRPIRVLDATGKKPVAGVQVRVGEQGWLAGRTSDDGLFAVPLPYVKKERILLIAEDGRGLDTSVEPLRKEEKGARSLLLPAPETLTGRIVSALGGRPIAGALVWSRDPGISRRTAADGTYRIEEWPAPLIGISAAAPGYFASQGQASGTPGQRRGPDLSLDPALAVAGLVVDEKGSPVAGVEIAASPSEMRTLASMRSGGTARTSPAGRFRIGALVAGTGHELRLSKPGFAVVTTELAPLEPGRPVADLRIVLSKGRIGFGRIMNQAEQPVSGAEVVLRPAQSGDLRRQMRRAFERSPLEYEAVTGADGRFELRDLPAGTYELTARGKGHAPLSVPGLAIPAGAGSTDLGTLLLAPGVPLEGYAADPAGKPVAGVEIYALQPDVFPMSTFLRPDATPAAVTGADGFFRIEDRRAGETIHLLAARDGYAPAEAPGVRVPSEPPVRLVLKPASTVEGKTVGVDGEPIAGAMIFAFPTDSMPLGGRRLAGGNSGPVTSDEEGSFRIENVPPGLFELRAMAPGRQQARLGNLEVRPGEVLQGLEIVLAPGATITGRVLSASGQPARQAEVRLQDDQTFVGTITDGEGRYSLEGVPPGRRAVLAEQGGRQAQRELDVRIGENTLDLTLEGSGFEISGHVVDPQGAPVANARISLQGRRRGWGQSDAVTGGDGAFTVSGVEDGTYRLIADREGFARNREGQEVTVAGSSVGDLEIRLSPGGAVVGRLLGLDFAELAQVQVSALREGRAAQVLPDGSYRLDYVEPGEIRVLARLPTGLRQAEGTVTLEPGAAEVRLDLDFGSGFTLSGRVLRNGEPAGGERVLLASRAGSSRWGETDHEGRFRFEGLEAGRYEVRIVSHRAGGRWFEELELTADRELLIELRTASVSGRVVDGVDRRPLANARISLLPPEGVKGGPGAAFPTEAVTDSRGLFQLRDAPEGTWKLQVSLSGYTSVELPIQVSAGLPVDEVELALAPAAPEAH
jgi:protocatechuate 3,4-dioxygenase beta subunit